jgi:flagellar biosynthesis anti-sigma factor FlgM
MKIGSNLSLNTIQAETNTGARSSASSPPTVEWNGEDASVSVSVGLAQALNNAEGMPSAQSSRVLALRQAISNGSYQINAGGIAEAMVREMY